MSNPTHYVGFLDPAYTPTFTDATSGAVLNLTGATSFSMFMVNMSSLTAKQCTGTWTISNQTTNPGQASYQWTSRDMDTAGNWLLYRSVQLASEPNPREFDPELLPIQADPAGGGITVSTQDVNIIQVSGNSPNSANPLYTDVTDRAARQAGKVGIQVGGSDVSSSNPVSADMTDRQVRLLGLAGIEGSSDGGSTYKIVKVASDGTLAVNSNLQAGVALAGGMMTYREMVSRALVGNVKFLTGTQALVSNGGTAAGAITLTDQSGNADAAVPNGKVRYIAYIDATLDMGGTTSAPLVQTSTITVSDGTNNKHKFVASSGGPGRDLALLPTIASGNTLTIKASPSNLATAVGNCVVTCAVWEE